MPYINADQAHTLPDIALDCGHPTATREHRGEAIWFCGFDRGSDVAQPNGVVACSAVVSQPPMGKVDVRVAHC